MTPSWHGSLLVSISFMAGNAALGTARCASGNSVYLACAPAPFASLVMRFLAGAPGVALNQLSSEGVAEPRTTGQLASLARYTAISRAE